MVRSASIIALVLALACGSTAKAEIGYKQNTAHQVLELSGLNGDRTCSSRLAREREMLSGKVVMQAGNTTNRNGLIDYTTTGFMFEPADGRRRYIEVVLPGVMSPALHQIVYGGLERLLKPGRAIHGQAVLCDAKREVLDELR